MSNNIDKSVRSEEVINHSSHSKKPKQPKLLSKNTPLPRSGSDNLKNKSKDVKTRTQSEITNDLKQKFSSTTNYWSRSFSGILTNTNERKSIDAYLGSARQYALAKLLISGIRNKKAFSYMIFTDMFQHIVEMNNYDSRRSALLFDSTWKTQGNESIDVKNLKIKIKSRFGIAVEHQFGSAGESDGDNYIYVDSEISLEQLSKFNPEILVTSDILDVGEFLSVRAFDKILSSILNHNNIDLQVASIAYESFDDLSSKPLPDLISHLLAQPYGHYFFSRFKTLIGNSVFSEPSVTNVNSYIDECVSDVFKETHKEEKSSETDNKKKQETKIDPEVLKARKLAIRSFYASVYQSSSWPQLIIAVISLLSDESRVLSVISEKQRKSFLRHLTNCLIKKVAREVIITLSLSEKNFIIHKPLAPDNVFSLLNDVDID